MIIKKEYPLSDLTGKIIGCAMEVHRHLGNARLTERAGFSENGNWFAHKFWKYIITIQKSYEAE